MHTIPLTFSNNSFENIYKIHGKQSLPDGSERRAY